jgi:hypothetical protein
LLCHYCAVEVGAPDEERRHIPAGHVDAHVVPQVAIVSERVKSASALGSELVEEKRSLRTNDTRGVDKFAAINKEVPPGKVH